MHNSIPPFGYAHSLQEYAVSESEYLSQHHDVHIICTGAVVFNKAGQLLLVQRAKDEMAFPNAWVSPFLAYAFVRCAFQKVTPSAQEIPGGKMDDTDETILHAAARELHEETGLTATHVVRRVAQFTFADGGKNQTWLKVPWSLLVL